MYWTRTDVFPWRRDRPKDLIFNDDDDDDAADDDDDGDDDHDDDDDDDDGDCFIVIFCHEVSSQGRSVSSSDLGVIIAF